ncbi:ComEA family DNA-binding protein [Streptomyces sp. WZ-12]|uniref:ComEA family DNA-binding protein n=1 Tax=Streptomyces sp. WZ-12 TaxID=3030210 RepID=UPI002381185F|nr:ComEA family DNA-binding protein [Streptomyces sp. WZ-12]
MRARAAVIFGAVPQGGGTGAGSGEEGESGSGLRRTGHAEAGGRADDGAGVVAGVGAGAGVGADALGAYAPGGGCGRSDSGAEGPHPHRAPPPREHDPPGARRAERWWPAVRERLPLWLQLRCGTDPKALVALVLVLLVGVGFAVQHFWAASPEPVRAPSAEGAVAVPGRGGRSPAPSVPSAHAESSGATTGAPPGGAGRVLVVDVVGKVRRPGIQRLPAGSRVTDALEAAGGVVNGTDLRGLNRARLLTDGEQIAVGTVGAGAGAGALGGAAGSGGSGSSGSGASGLASGPVSLNSATEQQLDALPGVGPVLARRIIEFRTRHGGFTSVDQLRQVAGIGERRLADLRSLVTP